MLQQSDFSIELWSKSGVRQAVLSGLATGRKIVESRNEPEEIEWNIPLELLERYARETFQNSRGLIIPRSTEARISYRNEPLVGGEIYEAPLQFTEQGPMINVKAEGFFNLLKDRFVEGIKTYLAVNSPDIAADLISYTQGFGPDWDYGITIDTMPTIGNHDITYDSINIKEAIQNLTRRKNAPFDIKFTPDKVFKAYAAIGSYRPEIIFSHPGNVLPGSSIPYFASELANRMLVYGSGISTDTAPPEIRDDLESQHQFKVRQAKLTLNDVTVTETLQDHGDSELSARSNPIELPTLKTDGNQRPYVTDYGIGDYVKVILKGYDFIERSVMLRVERREIDIDDNDRITVTNYMSI